MKKNKVIGIVCTVALHVLVLLLLFLLKLTVPAEQEEGGVPVMLGNTELAAGDADPYTDDRGGCQCRRKLLLLHRKL